GEAADGLDAERRDERVDGRADEADARRVVRHLLGVEIEVALAAGREGELAFAVGAAGEQADQGLRVVHVRACGSGSIDASRAAQNISRTWCWRKAGGRGRVAMGVRRA